MAKPDFRASFLFAIVLMINLFHFMGAQAETMSYSDLLSRTPPAASKRLAYGDDPNQFGELWLPDGPGPYPVIVMIHGGCWQDSLPGVVLMDYLAEDMRVSGFAVWNIEYRRLGHGGAGYPGTFLDIANGTDYLRKIDREYNLDTSHVVAVGHSAGGQLALWAAARQRIKPTSALYQADPLPVQMAVTLAGINDLRAYRDAGAAACGGPDTIDRLINVPDRSGENPYADTSPAAMLPLNVQQLIVSGSLDPIVPGRFGRNYGLLAKTAGDRVEILEIEGTGHFELIDPTSKAWLMVKDRLLSFAHLK